MTPASILPAFPEAERTVPAMLQRQAQRYGSHPLFAAGDVTWSFAEAPAVAARFAGTLAAAGIRPGDRIALMCGNRAEFMEAFLGCAWLGAVAVPLNVAARGPQLAHYLKNSGARLLIIEAELLDALAHIDFDGLALERIWAICSAATTTINGIPLQNIPQRASAIGPGATDPAQTLAILYTSGTTGVSKGVCCPHAQYFWWGLNGIRNLEIHEGDVLSTALPLFHTNALGTFHQALLSGSTLIAEPRFSASRFWQRLHECRATVTYVLGAMVPILLSRKPMPEERSHRVRCALAPGVPAKLHRAFQERTNILLLDGYGSTETNFVIGSTAAEQRAGSMGSVREGFEARVLDGSGNEVRPGEPGELVLRTSERLAFATGYFAMSDQTADAFRDGWFHTGDRVVREADGYFRFIDRLKDAIRRRGENISSFEVEQVLLSHPDVGNAAVFPVPSELAEEEVMAAIVRRPGSTLTERALSEYCEPRLAKFALPRFVEFVDALPTTESGKVQKYKLRDRGVSAKTWDRQAETAEIKQSGPMRPA